MRNKWFNKTWIISFTALALISITYSGAVAQFEQNLNISYETPFNSYLVDSSVYTSLFAQNYDFSSNFTNPYVAVSSQSFGYQDLFSKSSENSFNYDNIFGYSLSSGDNSYIDPFYQKAGNYLNISSLGGSFSGEYGYTQTALGGTSQFANSFSNPWTSYSSSGSVGYGTGLVPFLGGVLPVHTSSYVGASTSYGIPTLFAGLPSEAAATMSLIAYAPYTTQMDRVLGNQIMYTAEGMPFVPLSSYYNPHNSSHWFFDSGAKVNAGTTVTSP